MLLTLSALYPEVGVSFRISHLVFRAIRKALIEQIMSPCGLIEKDPAYHLSFIFSTKKACTQAEAKGPEISRRSKTITWGLWLPYTEISRNTDQREAFVYAALAVAASALSHYGVDAERVRRLAPAVLSQIDGDAFTFFER